MGNCLKTQLKESVQNNNLPKLGIFELKAATDNFSVFYLNIDGTETMHVDNGHFTNSAGTSDYGENMSKSGATGYIYITSGSTLSVNAYSLTSIILIPQGTASVCTTSTMQLSHCINCTILEIGGNTSGNIANLKSLLNLTTLKIAGTSIDGNLSSLLANKNTLRTIILPNTVVYTSATLQEFTTAGCTVTGGRLID